MFFPIPDPTFFPSRIRIFSIPDPGSGPDYLHIPDPGSRGQKGTGSRIRIRNTGYIDVQEFHLWIRILKTAGQGHDPGVPGRRAAGGDRCAGRPRLPRTRLSGTQARGNFTIFSSVADPCNFGTDPDPLTNGSGSGT